MRGEKIAFDALGNKTQTVAIRVLLLAAQPAAIQAGSSARLGGISLTATPASAALLARPPFLLTSRDREA